MKKLMLLAAMLALVLAAAVPAVAQLSNELGQETESAEISEAFEVVSEGDFAQQCVAPLQFGNTGNVQNNQGFVQYTTETDDVEFEGSSFSFAPSVATECSGAVQQSAAASS